MRADALSASGRTSGKLSLHTLLSKMKCDPEGYLTELTLIYRQFKSSVELFRQQAALNFTSVASGGVGSDPTVAKYLGDRAMFLAHARRIYPNQLVDYPNELVEFLGSSARVLPSPLRIIVTRALIVLLNGKILSIKETRALFKATLPLFMELQVLSDKTLKEKAFSHVIGSIRQMNQKHKNETENRALQSILFLMLEEKDEKKAMRSLVTICNLHRGKVWFDDRTANAICEACFHSSSSVMMAAVSFLLGYEKFEEDDSDDLSDEEEAIIQPHVVVSKEAIYKAKNTGTTCSKKKKKKKLQRRIRSMKKQQRILSERNDNPNYYSPLNELKDAQGFAEKLFSGLRTRGLCFAKKLMITKVVARTVGLHRLTLLKFYPFLQNYVQPHQKDVIHILAAAVQACHDMVPPDAVEPLFKQIVNQFVHDKSRTESIAVGLNVVREICLRMPLLMTEDLLQDLVLYKKSHEKAVSSAARSLISLFREICPSLLIKKDRGRPINPKAKPNAFGEVTVLTDVPGAELLLDDDVDDDEDDDVSNVSDGDEQSIEDGGSDDDISIPELNSEEEEEVSEDEGEEGMSIDSVKGQKRKFADFDGANQSLRALKRQATMTDGIYSNEDFQRIKRLNAKIALAKNGFKVPTSDQLRLKRVDGYSLEANIRKKMTKEERKALIKAGREDGEKYQSKAAIKQKKTGGLSNRQKEHKKAMPLAAKRSKVERSCRAKKMKQKTAGKQFRGRKAWK